jgi:hypothetical protein
MNTRMVNYYVGRPKHGMRRSLYIVVDTIMMGEI